MPKIMCSLPPRTATLKSEPFRRAANGSSNEMADQPLTGNAATERNPLCQIHPTALNGTWLEKNCPTSGT